MTRDSISNTDDLIYSRDVIERIARLQDACADFEHDDDGNRTNSDWASAYPSFAAELAALLALAGLAH